MSPWGPRPGSCSLAAALPESFDFSCDLIDQYAAHSNAKLFNIGCDETFDIGQGRSKELVDQRGKAHVYLDFLQRLCGRVAAHGKTPIYFGDIVLEHPELIGELPADGVLVNWNYESSKPFGPDNERFERAGVRYWVCPGTSGWCSVTGRGRNAVLNCTDAVRSGVAHGAEGCLLTEWGDHGHWQTQAVAWVGLVFGAGVSWCCERNADEALLPRAISRIAADEEDPRLGELLYAMANAYESGKHRGHNVTWWFLYLHSPGAPEDGGSLGKVDAEDADAGEAALDAVLAGLDALEPGNAEAALLVREARFSASLARWACRRAGERLRSAPVAVAGSPDPGAGVEFENLVAEHRALWRSARGPAGWRTRSRSSPRCCAWPRPAR